MGIARRNAAPRRKCEWKDNLGCLNSSRSNDSWRMTPKTVPWNHVAYELASAYSVRAVEHFGWVNIRAITFLFVDQSSSRHLETFDEDISTSLEVIGAHMLNFRPKFKLFANTFFRGIPVPVGGEVVR